MSSEPVNEEEVGLLSQLALRQEDYRGILQQVRDRPDKSWVDGIVAAEGMDEEQLIACATVLFELSHDPERNPAENDILWSAEFLDHLDTLGWKLSRK